MESNQIPLPINESVPLNLSDFRDGTRYYIEAILTEYEGSRSYHFNLTYESSKRVLSEIHMRILNRCNPMYPVVLFSTDTCSKKISAIIGGVIGAVALIVLVSCLIVILIICVLRSHRAKKKDLSTSESATKHGIVGLAILSSAEKYKHYFMHNHGFH